MKWSSRLSVFVKLFYVVTIFFSWIGLVRKLQNWSRIGGKTATVAWTATGCRIRTSTLRLEAVPLLISKKNHTVSGSARVGSKRRDFLKNQCFHGKTMFLTKPPFTTKSIFLSILGPFWDHFWNHFGIIFPSFFGIDFRIDFLSLILGPKMASHWVRFGAILAIPAPPGPTLL